MASARVEALKQLFHSTSKLIAPRIEKEGIQPLAKRMSSREIASFEDEIGKGYTSKVYLGADYEAARKSAVGGSDAVFAVSPRALEGRKFTYEPDIEGGLVSVEGGIDPQYLKRILGLAGLGVGGAMMTDEANASPIGNVIKGAAKKTVSQIASSTAKRLVGTEFKGAKITNVTKGARDWRYIHLDNDTVYPVTKDVLHDLSRKAGTDEYLGRLATKDEPSRLLQALKSLDYHRARSIPAGSKMMMKEYYKQWTAQLKEAGLPNVPSCMVKSGKDTFLMPTEYAEMLEKEGHLKILKRLQ